MTNADRAQPRRHLLRLVAVGAVFLALGIAATTALGARASAPQAAPQPATDAASEPDPAAPPATAAMIAAPEGRATTPADAVAQFLAAEQQADFTASYTHLTPDNREAVGSAPQWVAAHAQMPVVTGWQVGEVSEEGDSAQVQGRVALQPVLDEVAGLIPGSASATWQVERIGGEWFVDYDASRVMFEYPTDTTADDAVTRWVEARQACDEPTALEYDGGLVGQSAVADSLCGTDGAAQLSAARPLETPEVDVLLPPFGAEAEIWARAVDVTAPVPLRALVAPLGDQWIVIGVLQP